MSLSNRKQVIGVLFNDKGDLIKKISLLLDEEEEVLDVVYSEDVIDINILKITKSKNNNFVNRIQKEIKTFLIKYINTEKKNINLKYLYYDYFEKDEEDSSIIKEKLINEIKNNWNKRFDSFYETVKIFSKIKN